MKEPPVAEIIDVLGGTRPAARKLGLSHTTVDGWIRRNKIPDWRRKDVAREVEKANRTVSAVMKWAAA